MHCIQHRALFEPQPSSPESHRGSATDDDDDDEALAWAAALAREVTRVETLPVAAAERAEELMEKRYALRSWLDEREDTLA